MLLTVMQQKLVPVKLISHWALLIVIGIDGHHTGKKYQIHTSGIGETKDKAVKNTRQLWLSIRNEIEHKRSEGVL